MSQFRLFLKYWLLPLVWMGVIFSASGDRASFYRSSRIIEPILKFLFPHLSQHAVDVVVLVARKCAHLTEYAVLALLLWRALRRPAKSDPRPWSWKEPVLAVVLVALYAATDELHQHFVPGRDGAIRDVFIDTTGGLVGVLALRASWSWRRKRLGRPVETTETQNDTARFS